MTHPGVILLALGLLLIVAEIFIPGFIVLPIGVGLATAAVWTLLTDSWAALLIACAIHVTVAYLIIYRFFRRSAAPAHASNTDHMIGQLVLVTEAIDPQQGGYVKLYGDVWRAISENGEAFSVGTQVRILRLEGNKVIVQRV